MLIINHPARSFLARKSRTALKLSATDVLYFDLNPIARAKYQMGPSMPRSRPMGGGVFQTYRFTAEEP